MASVRSVRLAMRASAVLSWLVPATLLAQQPANLLRNGGFEEGPAARTFLNLVGGSTALPGWVVTGEGIDLVGAGHWISAVGTRALNDRLSLARAEAVKRWLVANGSVPEGRMTTRGFGPTRPVAPNDTAEGRQQNRRVEVRIRKD